MCAVLRPMGKKMLTDEEYAEASSVQVCQQKNLDFSRKCPERQSLLFLVRAPPLQLYVFLLPLLEGREREEGGEGKANAEKKVKIRETAS